MGAFISAGRVAARPSLIKWRPLPAHAGISELASNLFINGSELPRTPWINPRCNPTGGLSSDGNWNCQRQPNYAVPGRPQVIYACIISCVAHSIARATLEWFVGHGNFIAPACPRSVFPPSEAIADACRSPMVSIFYFWWLTLSDIPSLPYLISHCVPCCIS